MCRYFTFWGNEPRSVKHWLSTADNSLLNQSKQDNSNRPNPDGWGIVFQDQGEWKDLRNTTPAFEDKKYLETTAELETHLLMAHVRRKSQGPVLRENTHPFCHENWVFMHNGNIPNVSARKIELQKYLLNDTEVNTFGDTDSEYFFRYILARINELEEVNDSSILEILNQISLHLSENTPDHDQNMLALNFVLSNGEILISYRRNRPLSYCIRPEGLLISSEPVDNEADWLEIPENHFIFCHSPSDIKIIAGKSEEVPLPQLP